MKAALCLLIILMSLERVVSVKNYNIQTSKINDIVKKFHNGSICA